MAVRPSHPRAPAALLALCCCALLAGCGERRETVAAHPNGVPRIVETRNGGGELVRVEEFHFNALRKSTTPWRGGAPEGTYRSWRLDGTPEWTGELRAGKREGVWTLTQGAKRTVVERGSYSDGLKDGLWEAFYENGNPRELNGWRAGLPWGEQRSFHPDGTLRSVSNCWDDAASSRSLRVYNREGRLELERGCLRDLATGSETRYDFLGRRIDSLFRDSAGNLHGERRRWNAFGALLAVASYDRGRRDGRQLRLTGSGDTLMDCTLSNGNGRCLVRCDSSDAVCADTTWRAGVPDGRVMAWTKGKAKTVEEWKGGQPVLRAVWRTIRKPDGKTWDSTKVAEGPLENGRRNGLWRRWSRSGTLLEEAVYRDDSLFGEQRLYDTAGVLSQRRVHGGRHREIRVYSNSNSNSPERGETSTQQ